jgi:hypothetical protein
MVRRIVIAAAAHLACVPMVAAAAVPAAAAEAAGRVEAEPPWDGPSSQHVWIDAHAGVESVQLNTFNADFDTVSVGLLPTSGVGPTANVGAGLRLAFLTLGLRGHVASFQNDAPTQTVGAWQIWTLDAEAGLRIPLGRIEPHVSVAGGYASFGGFQTAVQGLSDGLDVHGVDARLNGGVDYWVTHEVSLGAEAGGGLLFVARPGVSARDLATPKQIGTLDDAKARVLEANGSSLGWTFAVTGDVGVHF